MKTTERITLEIERGTAFFGRGEVGLLIEEHIAELTEVKAERDEYKEQYLSIKQEYSDVMDDVYNWGKESDRVKAERDRYKEYLTEIFEGDGNIDFIKLVEVLQIESDGE